MNLLNKRKTFFCFLIKISYQTLTLSFKKYNIYINCSLLDNARRVFLTLKVQHDRLKSIGNSKHHNKSFLRKPLGIYGYFPKMKKIFSKFDKNEKLESSSKVNYTGKVFNVGKIKIEVEDTICEGQFTFLI